MPTKQIFPHTQSRRVFGHPFRVGLYAGGVTARTTCLSFSMMTLSPATGTLRLGQVAGSDQFVALAAGAAGLSPIRVRFTLSCAARSWSFFKYRRFMP